MAPVILPCFSSTDQLFLGEVANRLQHPKANGAIGKFALGKQAPIEEYRDLIGNCGTGHCSIVMTNHRVESVEGKPS